MGTSGGTSTKSTSSSSVESSTSTFFHLQLLQLPLQSGLHYLPSPSTLLQWIFTSQVELCGTGLLISEVDLLSISQCGLLHLQFICSSLSVNLHILGGTLCN